MRLAMSQIAWEEAQEPGMLAMLQQLGFAGLEIAPTRVAGPAPYEHPDTAAVLRRILLDDLAVLPGVQMRYSSGVVGIEQQGDVWQLQTAAGNVEQARTVLNVGYAGVNEINAMAGFAPFDIKYELCEMILCDVGDELRDVGITVMDGPFFSIMPFGHTGLHSLTSVTFTPHLVSGERLPTFPCQAKTGGACTPQSLFNCNDCSAHPESAWPAMRMLARKYLKDEYDFTYKGSLYSMKPILKKSEVDDSRPTLVRVLNETPRFISVLSGKINTVYDLEEVLV